MYNGVVNVRKEKGMTSFAVVARLRHVFGQKKIGHTGTLDPDAEGVLPICLGKATRLVETLTGGTKTYEAELLLGVITDTQDMTGTVLEEHPVNVTEEEVRAAILSFEGKGEQLPPMYSAVWVGGRRLYELARKGIEVERPVRPVEFTDMEVLSVEPPRARFRVTCTRGAYIRTLCEDIGRKLGCGAAMSALLRTRVHDFELADSLTIDEIARKMERGERDFILPIDHFFRELPRFEAPSEFSAALRNGNAIAPNLADAPEDGAEMRMYDAAGDFIGIYRRDGRLLKPVKMFCEVAQ